MKKVLFVKILKFELSVWILVRLIQKIGFQNDVYLCVHTCIDTYISCMCICKKLGMTLMFVKNFNFQLPVAIIVFLHLKWKSYDFYVQDIFKVPPWMLFHVMSLYECFWLVRWKEGDNVRSSIFMKFYMRHA